MCLYVCPSVHTITCKLLHTSALCLVVMSTGEKSLFFSFRYYFYFIWQIKSVLFFSESSNVRITGQRHFADGSRSFGKVTSYFCEIPYQMASFSGFSKRP